MISAPDGESQPSPHRTVGSDLHSPICMILPGTPGVSLWLPPGPIDYHLKELRVEIPSHRMVGSDLHLSIYMILPGTPGVSLWHPSGPIDNHPKELWVEILSS